MMKRLSPLMRGIRAFVRDEEGAATISFILVFPAFMTFFLMTYENGMISLRHVMLERGVDPVSYTHLTLPTTPYV